VEEAKRTKEISDEVQPQV